MGKKITFISPQSESSGWHLFLRELKVVPLCPNHNMSSCYDNTIKSFIKVFQRFYVKKKKKVSQASIEGVRTQEERQYDGTVQINVFTWYPNKICSSRDRHNSKTTSELL